MICKRPKIFYGLLPLFLLFFSFFFSSFSVNDTYAVEDYVVYVNNSNYTNFDLCNSSCSSYNYVLFSDFTSSVSDPSFSFSFRFALSSSSYPRLNFDTPSVNPPPFVLFNIPLSGNYFRLVSSQVSGSFSFKVTLSENNPYASGIIPSGSFEITENGTYDVTNYAEAVVNVPESSGGGLGGNYHEDLVNIYHAIMICGAIVLVLYFFYCIYRVIIKSTGGK